MAMPKTVEAPGRRAAHVEDTRQALLDAACDLFSERGYQATSTEEIVQRAGLTRGALYHHFRDKADLFAAVFHRVEDEVTRSLRRPSGGTDLDPWKLYRQNNEVYLNAASGNAAYRQIVLIDGPAVFGWDRWSRQDRADGSARTITRYVERAVAAGVLAEQPVPPLAQLLAALGNQAVMYIAHADDRAVARREMGQCIDRFLDGLRVAGTDRTSTDRTGTDHGGG